MIKVGDRFKTIRGEEYVVVEYLNYDSVTVEFCDNYKYKLTTSAAWIKSGQIKNPYSPRIFEVGYFGVGGYKAKVGNPQVGYSRTPEYQAWMNMMSRCYDKNYINPHLYSDVMVVKSWHCFQDFAEWYYTQRKDTNTELKLCLDKDVLGDGSMYSPEFCCLLPFKINSLIVSIPRGNRLPGVVLTSKGRFRVSYSYGKKVTEHEHEKDAHLEYLNLKLTKIRDLANEYKEILRPHVYETLMTKDFRYKFSPLFENPVNRIGQN